MKKNYLLILLSLLFLFASPAKPQIIQGYNSALYNSVLNSAQGVAKPFLLQQGFLTMPGLTIINDTTMLYQSNYYYTRSKYQNPIIPDTNNYYLPESVYSIYGINIFRNLWQYKIPNAFYNSSESKYYSLFDCVGYGTRLLSATGDTTQHGNGYLSLIHTVKTANTSIFAERGFVASAYEFAAAFATLPDTSTIGWMYICGKVIQDSINAYNHRKEPGVGTYNGRTKGGYSQCQPGDILTFGYAPGGADNGHFMVMTQSPYQVNYDTLQRLYPNVSPVKINQFLGLHKVFATPLLDCSGQNIHFYDSRLFHSGIGYGMLFILTDHATETPQGFIFRKPSAGDTTIKMDLINSTSNWAITIGRFNKYGVGITKIGNEIPDKFNIGQNYPNPFNSKTKIIFEIPETGFIKISVFDITGKEIKVLLNEYKQEGKYNLTFDANGFASGIYFYKITAGKNSKTLKMIFLK